MTIYFNTVLDSQISEVAVAGMPFSAGVPVFRRLDGKVVPLSGGLTIAQASLQNIAGGTPSASNALLKTTAVPNSNFNSGNNEYGDRMIEAGGMLFMVYKNAGELRTCWAAKDGTTEVDMLLVTGTCQVSDIVTDGTNIAVLAFTGSQMKIFFFNASQRNNGSNGQVLSPIIVAGATGGPPTWNHVFDVASGNLFYAWVTGTTLFMARTNIVTGISLQAVTVSTSVVLMYVHQVSKTRSFDLERFGTGQLALVYKGTASEVNFVVYDSNLGMVGAVKTATSASIGTLGNYSTRRISALGSDKICWGTQTATKAVLFVLTNAGVLTSLLTASVSSQRSSVMGRLADGRVAFAFADNAGTMDLSVVNADGTLQKRGLTIVTGVGPYGSHLIVPFGDRFLLLAAAEYSAGRGAVFLNDGTPVSLSMLNFASGIGVTDGPGYGWAVQKANASGTAATVHGVFRYQFEDSESNAYEYYQSIVVCINSTGTENFKHVLIENSSISKNGVASCVSDGMQAVVFGHSSSGTRYLMRFVFEQCIFSGIAGSHCPNEGDLSYIFGKGSYRIAHPNATFNYLSAAPFTGPRGSVSSGVLTLN
jgi:hypothetical protein